MREGGMVGGEREGGGGAGVSNNPSNNTLPLGCKQLVILTFFKSEFLDYPITLQFLLG